MNGWTNRQTIEHKEDSQLQVKCTSELCVQGPKKL